jgi:photosystem II stability/assembly factor-like uncharacterized protein
MKTLAAISFAVLYLVGTLRVVAQDSTWERMSGPCVGPTSALAVNAHLIVAGNSSGVFLTTDQGATWLNSMLPNGGGQFAFVLLGDTILAGSDRDQLFISQNKGQNWTAIDGWDASFGAARCLIADGDRVFAGSPAGVFVSTDGGHAWAPLGSGNSPKEITSLAISGSTMIAGVAGKGVQLSTDDGVTWAAVNRGLTSPSCESLAIVPSPDSAGAPAFLAAMTNGIYRSNDNGATWFPVAFTRCSMFSDPIDPSTGMAQPIYAATTSGVMHSTDGGILWNPIGRLYSVSVVAYHEGEVYAGKQGLYHSTDLGITWREMGIASGNIDVLAWRADQRNGRGSLLLAASTQNKNTPVVYRSTDEGRAWSSHLVAILDTVTINAMYTFADRVFAGTTNGIFISRDDGIHWNRTDSVGGTLNATCMIRVGPDLLAGTTGSGIWMSSDSGTTWRQSSTAGYSYRTFFAKDSLVLAGLSASVIRSTDLGRNWMWAMTGWPAGTIVSRFAAFQGFIMAATNKGCFISTDSGILWNLAGTSSSPVNSLVSDGKNAYAAFGSFVRAASDVSLAWKDTRLYTSNVRVLAISDSFVFAGTEREGVLRLALDDIFTSLPAVDARLPGISCFLDQNFPNPIMRNRDGACVTMVPFRVTRQTYVVLTIHDIAGRKLGTLVSEVLQPGLYHRIWNTQGLPNGMYFVRLEADNAVSQRMAALVR